MASRGRPPRRRLRRERARGVHLELRCGPRPPGAAAGAYRPVEGNHAELAAAERRSRAGRARRLERVRVIRHEHDCGVSVRAAAVIHELQVGCGAARSENVRRRREERSRLGVPVGWLSNSVAVDPEGDVVEEEAAVHLRDVDPALDTRGERVERAEQVVAIDAEIEREVVPCAGRRADERPSVRDGCCGDDSERPVAAGHAERVRAARHGVGDQRGKIVVRAQDNHLDSALARTLGESGTRSLATARPRVDEQHGLLRGIGGSPAGMHGRHDQPMLTALRRGGSPAGSSLRDSFVLAIR